MRNFNNIPKHIGIIMDGNGRWAKKNFLPRSIGHLEGMKRVIDCVRYFSSININILSLYAFSTENWKRPKSEVDYLMFLLVKFIKSEIKELKDNNIKISVIGEIKNLPKEQFNIIKYAINETMYNTGMVLNLCINYGGKQEIVGLVKDISNMILNKEININEINQELIEKKLYSNILSDIDLLIRPGGEKRLSNFMLYHNSYSEFIFLDILWPEFNIEIMESCIEEYKKRQRRYGGIDE